MLWEPGKNKVEIVARYVIGVVVIKKNQDNSIVLSSGEGAIIAVSLGIFLGLVKAGEVNLAEVNFNGGKLTS